MSSTLDYEMSFLKFKLYVFYYDCKTSILIGYDVCIRVACGRVHQSTQGKPTSLT